MLDIAMIASIVVLAVLMLGLLAWAGNVAEEGSGKS